MKFPTNNAGFAVILMASLLAACSSAPVDESSSTIEDNSVQAAELEMQRQAEAACTEVSSIVELLSSTGAELQAANREAIRMMANPALFVGYFM